MKDSKLPIVRVNFLQLMYYVSVVDVIFFENVKNKT